MERRERSVNDPVNKVLLLFIVQEIVPQRRIKTHVHSLKAHLGLPLGFRRLPADETFTNHGFKKKCKNSEKESFGQL